jgi:trimethylamine--corrinoid protein Co-methyltransferase
MICSAEMLVLGDEAAGMVERLIRGIDVNAGTLARDLIHKVGPGGNFLQEEHTLNNFRKELWIPSLMSRETCDAWRDRGAKDVSARAREKIVEILETHKVTPLPDRVVAALERIKQSANKELAPG